MTISKAEYQRMKADCDGLRAALIDRTEQRDALLASLAATTKEYEETRTELSDIRDRANREREATTSRINDLKRTIADLECDLADARGYARALNERIEHDSPLVEIPQAVRRCDINRDDPDRHYSAMTSIRDTERRPKHWTAV